MGSLDSKVVAEKVENRNKQIFNRDKNKSDKYIFTFDLTWFVITCAFSLLKFDKLNSSSTDNSDIAYFVLIFALPILIKHILRLHFFQTLGEFTGKHIILFYRMANFLFILSGLYFSGVLFLLSIHDFKMNTIVYVINIIFHIIVILLGFYDKLMVKLKPVLKEVIKMLLIWIAIILFIALVLFVATLFVVTLSYVDDVEVSYFILIGEIKSFLFMRRDRKIEIVQEMLNNDREKSLKKIVKKKDSELMDILSISKEAASEFKEQVRQDLKEKKIFYVTKEEVSLFMESEDLLSFLGSYKVTLEIFSDSKNIAELKRDFQSNRLDKLKRYEEVYEFRVNKDDNDFKDIFKGTYRMC